MDMLHAGLGALIVAIAVAFTGLVASKAATGLWVVLAALGRGLYWLTIGWWFNKIKSAVVGF